LAEFYVSVPELSMAQQVSTMVNQHNKWYTRFSAAALLSTQSRYFVELNGDKVVACAAIQKEYPTLSKVYHVCVLPEFRRQGLARKLVELSIMHCETEHVYMTVREDNLPSLKMANSLGFVSVKKDWFRDHFTYTLARRKMQ
jgi:ribosomal protein S18 acetylase RimI-like enzyme